MQQPQGMKPKVHAGAQQAMIPAGQPRVETSTLCSKTGSNCVFIPVKS